ncbi:hypothetical protein GEMRC1_003245 [Eukaryota sp. GEM-RC1]
MNDLPDIFDLKGSVAVVTGASSGIGVQFAKALAIKGCDLALLARRLEKLNDVAAEVRKYGVRCETYQCDVTSTENVNAVAEQVKKDFGTMHILINNAGGNGGMDPIENLSDKDWNFVLDLNLTSIMKVSRAFGPMMIEQKYGRVINVASMFGMVGSALNCSAYHATKAAVCNLSRSMAADWAKHQITVNSLCPGFFLSELTGDLLETDDFQAFIKSKCPSERQGNVGELDSAVLFLASKQSGYVTGITLPVDGGWTCV